MGTHANSDSGVKLEPAGAGLPRIEALITRYVIFPLVIKRTSWLKADELFEREAETIQGMAARLSQQQRDTQVLIERVRGIEDSSRHWSVSMTIEHLIIVGKAISNVLPPLITGEGTDYPVSIAAVKPTVGAKPAILNDFASFTRQYLSERRSLGETIRGSATLEHPWFGQMNALQWHALAAFHHGIH